MLVDRSLEVGLVTAGLPALTPARRYLTHSTRLQRDKSRRAMLEALEKESAASDVRDGETDTSVLEAQIGRPLTSLQLEQRLKKCNSSLYFERAIADPTKTGIYQIREGQKFFLLGMEAGYMPEFSVRHVETEKVPDTEIDGATVERRKFVSETRGWRTVLARLLRNGLVTVGQIEQYFQVSSGRSSQTWQLYTN